MRGTSRLMRWIVTGALAMAATAHAREIHVSSAGKATNTGAGAESALPTIQAAVDLAQPGDVVRVHPGTYRETVVFPRSGTADQPITLRAAGDGQAIISGCDPINGWEQYKAGVWKANMPWTLGPGRNQAFDAEGVLIEARIPNIPSDGLGMYVSDLSPLWPTFGEFSIPKDTMAKQPGRIVSKLLDGQPDDYWKGACYYGVHYEGWSAQTGIVESSKSGEIRVGDRTRTWWFGSLFGGNYSPEEGRGMIVGHMNALDQPTEWHWQDNTLYLIPRKPGMPSDIQAKRRQLALDLSGRQYICIEGLKIVGASLRLDGSSFCIVDRCNLSYISHFTRFYDIGQIEHGKDTIRSGETGIFVSGHDNRFTNCSLRYSAGAGFHLRGYHHTIHNCLLDEIDYTSHYLNAITDAVSDYGVYENTLVGGHVIAFNTMRNAGRHFFNFNGNGTSTASRDRKPMDYMATLFAHNHLYNGMLQTRDAGFLTGYFSSGGTLNGLRSQVSYNVLHDCYDIAGMKWGVIGMLYLDQGTCDVEVHHNLLWAAPGAHQRGMWFNTACVNIGEHDNVFWPMFARTTTQLQAGDFPGQTPFRFGHDFEHPPEVPQWPPLLTQTYQADKCADASAGVKRTPEGLTGLRDRDWFRLDGVDLGQPWQTALCRFATDARAINADLGNRRPPRHLKTTDPLVLEVDGNNGLADGIRRQWTLAYNIKDGAWIRFNKVPLGDGYQRLRVTYGCDKPAPRRLELRLDRPDGPLVSTAELRQTDRTRGNLVQIYADAFGELSPQATGTHDLFLVFHSDDGKPVAEVEYFRLEQYRGQIPLAKNEVKLEIRVGAPDGPKMGEFYPGFTGGADTHLNLVAKLEPAVRSERGSLVVVVRSAMPDPIGTIQAISLQRASWSGGPIPGIGLPPRQDAQGKPIYPEPTNLPCARPADKYAASAVTPRPVLRSQRVEARPVVDPATGLWAGVRKTPLVQSYDGEKSAGTPSTAQIAYDDQALYVALQNPLPETAGLTPSAHASGQCDGAEVAIQDGLSEKPGPILVLYGYPDGVFQTSDAAGAPQAVLDRVKAQTAYTAAVDQAGWSCQWRIPFAACGFTPASSPRVLVNLGVFKKGQKAWVVLHGTGGSNHNVERGATLLFPDEFTRAFALPRQNLSVWLDAADAASVVRDEAGQVSLWSDRSGSDHAARQPLAPHRPTYNATGLNAKPALIFDAKRQTRLELPDLAPGKVDATIFAVVANPVEGAPENHDPRIFTASDGKGYDYQIGLCCSVPGTQTGGPRLIVASSQGAWAKQVRVGCFSPSYQTYFTGPISEIIVYTAKLPPAQVQQVSDYLSAKWELP